MSRTLSHEQPALTETRAARLAAVGIVALTAAAMFTPLVQVPGYELAELLTLFNALAAAPLAVAALKRDDPRAPVRAALDSAGFLLLLDLFATSAVALRAAFGSRCSPFTGLPFIAALPVATALLAPCLAVGAACLWRRRPMLLYFLGLLALLAHAAWPGYKGPQAFGYDHLLGYFPGPLYDESLRVPAALWLFRLLTLGLVLLSLLTLRLLPAITPVVFAVALALTGRLEHRIGTRSSIADLDRALGETLELRGLVIHVPRELPASRREELLHAAAIAREQVAEALGTSPTAPVDVFFHRSTEEKGKLTGAGQTDFTKPWLHQIQIEVDGTETLRHEMVHALAAQIGGGPFGVGRSLDFNIGIVEGLAEAIDWPVNAYTLDEWTAGMKAANLFIPPKTLLKKSAAFYAAPQGTAYTVAGSFIHWLLTTRGPKPMAVLYREQSFERSFGKSLPELSDEFEADLSKTPVSPQLTHAAAERFRARTLFARPCGREVAELRDRASGLEGAGQFATAAQVFGRCAALDPGEPRYLESRWRTLREAHDPAADQALADLLASPAIDDAVRARVAVARGTAALLAGHSEEAEAAYREALSLGVDPPSRRAIQIRLLALPHPDLAPALHRALDEPPDDLALLALSEASDDHPDFAPLPYLIGLRLAAHREWRWSHAELQRALDLDLPDELRAQALRTEVRSELALNRPDQADSAVAALKALARPPAEKRAAEDLADQVRIARDLFETPPAGM